MFTALIKLFQIDATMFIEHIFQSHEDFDAFQFRDTEDRVH